MGFYDEKKALFHYFKLWNEVGSTYRHTPIPMNKQTLLQRCENAFKSRGDNFFLLVNKSFHFPLFRSPLLQIKSGSKVLAAALKQSARSRTALVESKKGLSTLVLLLKDKDEMIVGNAALGLSLCSEVCYSIVEFLDAPPHLYKRVCPSVGPSVRPSVRPSVCPERLLSDVC